MLTDVLCVSDKTILMENDGISNENSRIEVIFNSNIFANLKIPHYEDSHFASLIIQLFLL